MPACPLFTRQLRPFYLKNPQKTPPLISRDEITRRYFVHDRFPVKLEGMLILPFANQVFFQAIIPGALDSGVKLDDDV